MDFFAFFDKKSGSYRSPQHFPHRADAIRAAEKAVNDPEGRHYLAEHPSDYDLYAVGAFDPAVGMFISSDPEFLVSIASLRRVSGGV